MNDNQYYLCRDGADKGGSYTIFYTQKLDLFLSDQGGWMAGEAGVVNINEDDINEFFQDNILSPGAGPILLKKEGIPKHLVEKMI